FGTFRKLRQVPLTDAFDDRGAHADYDASGACKTIELFCPAEPVYQDRRILGRPYREVRRWAVALDPSLRETDAGFDSTGMGFGVYAPPASKQPDDPVEGVIVFARGYLRDV